MHLKFRCAELSEGRFLTELALRSKSYWDYDKDYLEMCREALTVNKSYITNNIVMIGEVNNEIIGFFSLAKVKGENRLDNLWIEPSNIRNGYGTIFFNEALKYANQLGWSSVRLAADPPAEGFYIKMGMENIGKVQSKIKPDLYLEHMHLNL